MTNELEITRQATVEALILLETCNGRLLQALAAVERLETERQNLRAGIAWAYQAIGAQWPNEQALDNLSALNRGEDPPHEWPVVPPSERQSDTADGVALIAAERDRQVSTEGWTPEHDDQHTGGELLGAGLSYAAHALDQIRLRVSRRALPGTWPWSAEWWKPSKDPIRNLVKAGALIAAEIDRLKRAAIESTKENANG